MVGSVRGTDPLAITWKTDWSGKSKGVKTELFLGADKARGRLVATRGAARLTLGGGERREGTSHCLVSEVLNEAYWLLPTSSWNSEPGEKQR